ncbi:MAG: hypothetical protein NTZ49_01720 [Candidatus Parcubacteria bacterium]|nr:hypothetical protein [Candidatus Parcubacteria bacterium]
MTTQVVTDEQYGKVAKRMHELQERLAKGAVEFQPVMDGLQQLIEGKSVVEAPNPEKKLADMIADWQIFYREVFGQEVDFSGLKIPERRKGFDRLIILAQGMTPQRLYDKCKQLFPTWKWTEKDLDEIVTSDRTAKDGAYAIWVRDRVEADKELKNLSANALKEKKINGITLEERFVYELTYFRECGRHLDGQNVTLCSGSRYSDGDVPSVGFYTDKVYVDYYNPDDANAGLRSRAVSC